MILDICHTVQSIGHILISDTGIATCVYQCSNMIIRAADIVGFSSEDERSRVMGRLEKVTDILEGLREVNTHVDDVVSNWNLPFASPLSHTGIYLLTRDTP